MNESTRTKLHLNIDYRYVAIALLVVIVAMLIIWKPWSAVQASDRTIDVTGQATVGARPDKFVFYPAYEFASGDGAAALEQLTAKSDEVVAKLKELGVADKDIKTNSDSWQRPVTPFDGKPASTPVYTLRLTVTTDNEELTQKVQDYLVSTAPTGAISPQPTFSEAKLKEVESKARDDAAKDARAKAEQSASNLGFKLASVKAVSDGSGFGSTFPATGRDMATTTMESGRASLAVQPGENELTYSVTVTYYLK